jgi:hypothetical protein
MNFKTISTTILFTGLVLALITMIIIPVGGMNSANKHADIYIYMFGSCELICIVGLILIAIAYRKSY